jgi:hypothetical protein
VTSIAPSSQFDSPSPVNYRSLITWAETDVGRFHRRISMLMFAAAAVVALVGAWKWRANSGTGYLLVSLLASSTSLAWDLWPRAPESLGDQREAAG